mmetsp:Transcript_23490/g.32943  ORF Transcript_23490/g.32943 Transcript_23490/m.32943 type:complete len:290 (+) Transcript_23490:29-898(+)
MTPSATRAASVIARRLGRTALSSRSTVCRSNATLKSVRGMASVSAGNALSALAQENPHKDILRYQHKNMKWSFSHVDKHSDDLAVGFLEQGLQPGDVVLSWLPAHFAETHILQFACSKAGFVLYNLDPSQAVTDPEGAKASLEKALEITEANVLVTQEAGDDTNYIRLVEDVIPEVRIFNFQDGMPFLSPRFPHLRFPIHTGLDQVDKWGFLPFKHMLVPSGELSNLLAGKALSGATPVMGELTTGADGLPAKGKVLSNDEVIKSGVWPIFSSILKKEYQEIEGVGVVF